ncbi:MAG: hypothetical protein ACI4MI_02415 [Christensenellales bacterium]
MAKKRPVTKDLSDEQKLDIIRNKTVEEKMKRRTVSKWIALLLLIALLITGSVWGVLSLIDYNSMKISINKDSTGLALSETADFSKPATMLDMKGPDVMEAMTYSDIRIDSETITKEGPHGSSGYIAYTVFLKNVADYKSLKYKTAITLPKAAKDVDKAIRIMVVTYRDGQEPDIKVYAEAKAPDTPEYIAYNSDDFELQQPITLSMLNAGKGGFEGAIQLSSNKTQPFLGYVEGSWDYHIDLIQGQDLGPSEVVKYMVIMWLEGSDAQCKDDILGGYCTVEIEFTVEEYGQPDPLA